MASSSNQISKSHKGTVGDVRVTQETKTTNIKETVGDYSVSGRASSRQTTTTVQNETLRVTTVEKRQTVHVSVKNKKWAAEKDRKYKIFKLKQRRQDYSCCSVMMWN